LDNLEFEVVAGTCGTPDRDGVGKNGTNEICRGLISWAFISVESWARRVNILQ
jgi:hypothetical protein